MHYKWNIGPAAHEFGQHYSYGPFHLDGLGNHSANGGGIVSAYDREHIGWTSGNIYQPTSNTTNIQLRDYVTTGDYLKIQRNGKTYYVENRRRINYYSTNNIHSWRWTANEPLLAYQRDSGLLIYKIVTGGYDVQHGFGKWDWENCSNGRYIVTKTPYYNEFIPKSVSKFYGKTAMNLFQLDVADINCNTIINQYTGGNITKDSYIGWPGDTNMCFDVDYNMVYSPWSNPAIPITSSSDSLTIELTERNSDGSLLVNVFFTSITQAAPSKPQSVKALRNFFGSPVDAFHPKIIWNRNLEPDISKYNVYRGFVSTIGVDPTNYDYIGQTSDTVFLDVLITLYRTGSGSGPCEREPLTYSYKVTAVDSSDKESVKSQRDSIYGYYDPCGAYGEDMQNTTGNNKDSFFKNNLSQNYPNPFNPATLIVYEIKNSGFVQIKIYDLLGKEITILLNDFKLAGQYSVKFDATLFNLSSGIYFYTIETANYVEAKRMLILK